MDVRNCIGGSFKGKGLRAEGLEPRAEGKGEA